MKYVSSLCVCVCTMHSVLVSETTLSGVYHNSSLCIDNTISLHYVEELVCVCKYKTNTVVMCKCTLIQKCDPFAFGYLFFR